MNVNFYVSRGILMISTSVLLLQLNNWKQQQVFLVFISLLTSSNSRIVQIPAHSSINLCNCSNFKELTVLLPNSKKSRVWFLGLLCRVLGFFLINSMIEFKWTEASYGTSWPGSYNSKTKIINQYITSKGKSD